MCITISFVVVVVACGLFASAGHAHLHQWRLHITGGEDPFLVQGNPPEHIAALPAPKTHHYAKGHSYHVQV